MKTCPQCQLEYAQDVDFCPADGTKLRARRDAGEDPLIGRALDGRWVIEEKLGEGGMGAVYRGHQKSVSRTVAIKTLRPQLVDSDEFVDRFFREAKIAATISHPNSVTILDYGEAEDGTLYLAMEFLDGELLTDRIETTGVSVREVLQVAMQVASALSAAHDNHIVHRDLKPDNIFLIDVPGGATFVKVLDFGIAKMLDSKTQVTKTGMIFGTPEYMSPEQCRGDQIDGRSDLYSLGCIMYELVGGRTPFRATTPMAVLMAHVNEAAPALSPGGTAAHVPQDVENIIMRLLEKNPENRFASATELRETLETVLKSLDNPNSTTSGELVRPVPSREIVSAEVSMGFDETMGMASTGPATPAEVRRDRPETHSVAGPAGRSRGPILALVLVLIGVFAAAAIAMTMLNNPKESSGAETPANAEVVQPPPAPPAEPAEPVVAVAPAEEPDAGTADVRPPEEDSPTEAVAVAPKAKKKKKKKSRKTKDEPKPEPEPEVVASPNPVVVAEPTPTPTPEPKAEPKKKKKSGTVDTVNDKAEKLRDKAVKGTEKKLNKVLDGLFD